MMNSLMSIMREHVFSIDSKLHEAAYAGDLCALHALISNPDNKELLNAKNHLGCTPLRLATTGGHASCMQYLLAAGADIDVSDIKAQTSLFVAVKNRNLSCMRLLLDHGAAPDADRSNLSSPLYIASMVGFKEGVLLLLDYGADVTSSIERISRSFRMTPLHVAVAYQHYMCLRYLLLAGCNPNGCDLSREYKTCVTLYHVALKQKCGVQFIKLLYNFGTNLFAKDVHKLYPWDLSYGDIECDQYLQEIRDCPRSLKSACRLQVREALTWRRLKSIDQLPLPRIIIEYLQYEDSS